MPPPLPLPPPVDMTRPECRVLQNEVRELQRQLRYWASRLQSATTDDEREGILATIDGLENSIQVREEQLFEQGCYIGPTVPEIHRLVEVRHLELTQSIQYYGAEGSGATATTTFS